MMNTYSMGVILNKFTNTGYIMMYINIIYNIANINTKIFSSKNTVNITFIGQIKSIITLCIYEFTKIMMRYLKIVLKPFFI